MAVYTQETPTEAPALMKYGEIVQDLASRSQNWKFYDENFPFLRQSDPNLYQSWGNIHWELWLQAQVNTTKQSLPANKVLPAKINKQGPIPKGFCYRFHMGKDCPGCDYKHTCFKCEGNHSSLQCNFRPPRSTPEPLPSPISSNHSLPTPVKVDRLCKLLFGYKPSIVDFLYKGFSEGFPLHFEGEFITFKAENLLTARCQPDVVSVKLQKELEAHRLEGPF